MREAGIALAPPRSSPSPRLRGEGWGEGPVGGAPCIRLAPVMAGLDPATSIEEARWPRINKPCGARIGMAGSSPAMTMETRSSTDRPLTPTLSPLHGERGPDAGSAAP
jgi:hypothetical protein